MTVTLDYMFLILIREELFCSLQCISSRKTLSCWESSFRSVSGIKSRHDSHLKHERFIVDCNFAHSWSNDCLSENDMVPVEDLLRGGKESFVRQGVATKNQPCQAYAYRGCANGNLAERSSNKRAMCRLIVFNRYGLKRVHLPWISRVWREWIRKEGPSSLEQSRLTPSCCQAMVA